MTVVNVPLLLAEKPSSVQFSHRGCHSHGCFLCLHQCQLGQLLRSSDKCVSCGRSYFGVADANDALVFPRREPVDMSLPLSLASGLGVKSRDCALPGLDASRRCCIVWEIHDGIVWKWKCWFSIVKFTLLAFIACLLGFFALVCNWIDC